MIRRPPRATRTDTLLSLHDALPIYTSAVALAAALGADRCDIYTDVDGVYTCDPRIVAKARKLDKVTYEEMLEMASQGAKILQTRSVRSEEHTSELQSLMRISYAVFCLKKKKQHYTIHRPTTE